VRIKQQYSAIKNSADQIDIFQKQFIDDSRKRPQDYDDQTNEEMSIKKARFGAEVEDENQKTIIYGKNGFGNQFEQCIELIELTCTVLINCPYGH